MKTEDYNNNHSESGELSVMGEIDEEICLEQALDGLPEDRQNKIRRIVAVAQESSFAGPLPHPSHFEGYNKVLPGAAERILAMAERQQAMAEKQQDYDMEQKRKAHSLLEKGLWIALFLMVSAFATVVFCIYKGSDNMVYATLGTSVIMVAIFVLREFPKNKII